MAASGPADVVLTVPVAARPEVVWAALTDWARQGEWMLGTHVRATGGAGVGRGATLRAVTGVGGRGIVDTMEITGWDPPRRCEVRHTGRVVRGTGAFEVRAEADGTSTFIWSESLDLPWGALGRVGFALTRPLFEQGVRVSLQRFARWAPGYQQVA